MTKKIGPQDSCLTEARSFIQRLQIQDRRVDIFTHESSEHHSRQRQSFNSLSHPGSAKHFHSRRLKITRQIFLLCQALGNHCDSSPGIDDEIKRLLYSFDSDLATDKSTRGSTNRNLNYARH